MKIEDILEEKHIIIYEQIVSYIEKTIQNSENLKPLMGILTKKNDSLSIIPFPPEMLNNGQSKAVLDVLIKKFIEYLKDKGDEPYAFIMLTEAWVKRMSTEEEAKNFKGSLKDEEIKNEIFMLNINSIKGDIIFSYDVIRDNNSSLYVASENSKVLLSYTPEEKEKQNNNSFSNRFIYF